MGGVLTHRVGVLSGGAPPSPSSAQYWRLKFPAGSPGADLGVREVEFRATVGGADLTSTSAANCSASSITTALPANAYDPVKAFDNALNTEWFALSGSDVNAWIANNFGSASDVAEFTLHSAALDTNFSPTEITVEYSVDGSTWYPDTRWPSFTGLLWTVESTYTEIKRFRRAATPSIIHAAQLDALDTDSGGWVNFTLRNVISANRMPNGGGTSRLRISFRGGNAEGLTINKCYVQIKGAGAYEFSTTPVQVTFDGGSNSTTIGTATTKFSDDIAINLTDTDGLVVSVFVPTGSTAADTFRRGGAGTGVTGGFKAGDDAATVTPSGYTASNFTYVDDVEVWNP